MYTRNMESVDSKIAQFTSYRRIVEDASIELGDSRTRLGEWKEKMKKLLAEKDEMYQSVKNNIHYLNDTTQALQRASSNINQIDINNIHDKRAEAVKQIKTVCVDNMVQRVRQIIEKAENDVRDQNINDSERCCVCLIRKKNMAIIPCGHMCVCASCASRIVLCPICMKPATQIIRIFS